MIENKQQHIQMLETRLDAFGERPSLPKSAVDAYATLKTWLQSSDDQAILR